MTAGVKIFAVAHQDHYISKTGGTLNEPESRAFTTDPCPHAFGTKNVNLTVYSRAMVKVGPLARIRIDDKVCTQNIARGGLRPFFFIHRADQRDNPPIASCWRRVFLLLCGYTSQQWGVPLVSRGSPRICFPGIEFFGYPVAA